MVDEVDDLTRRRVQGQLKNGAVSTDVTLVAMLHHVLTEIAEGRLSATQLLVITAAPGLQHPPANVYIFRAGVSTNDELALLHIADDVWRRRQFTLPATP